MYAAKKSTSSKNQRKSFKSVNVLFAIPGLKPYAMIDRLAKMRIATEPEGGDHGISQIGEMAVGQKPQERCGRHADKPTRKWRNGRGSISR